jgi:hypothetical protein
MALRSMALAALLSVVAVVLPLTVLLPDPAPPPAGVGKAVYDLGDAALELPGWNGPNELRGIVHYPTGGADQPRPMIVLLHGRWRSCVDTATHWPCAELESYRGFDYLGDTLARQGFVVVSVGANGIGAANPAAGYRDRAELLNAHLRMWRDLVTTGRGPLAGRFADPATGRDVQVDFRARIDLGSVGTMGHGEGGTAAMQHADSRFSWPEGVRVRAVLAAAPVYNYAEPAVVTDIPFAVLDGGCDATRGRLYLTDVHDKTTTGAYAFTVAGANHNNLNTKWPTGQCTDGQPAAIAERQLTGAEQRRVATGYAAAFFLRHLLDRTEYDAMLTGRTSPLADITRVDVKYAAPIED